MLTSMGLVRFRLTNESICTQNVLEVAEGVCVTNASVVRVSHFDVHAIRIERTRGDGSGYTSIESSADNLTTAKPSNFARGHERRRDQLMIRRLNRGQLQPSVMAVVTFLTQHDDVIGGFE